ncbi:CDP-glycerol glycerophosphotransferase family protein [Leucobacter aridicollis]|uniref:CDP-glycerol glycerophosphotransferase family protein n=1 Tax=Leucobacter aridicollis TaxID=283878 RepID=UPI002103D3EC|nr:CDP-glycerol glycerophosphotransferase family protein [Leucobacter aridicollis]UTX53524.1 CDP-glycerol glycerophosphotransferase family protein [Leucobacter aridicollis]
MTFVKAGDTFSEGGIQALLGGGGGADILVGHVATRESPQPPEWYTKLAKQRQRLDVESQPRLLSSSDPAGKIFSAVYLDGLLANLAAVDYYSLAELTYLALLGARSVQLRTHAVVATAGFTSDVPVVCDRERFFLPLILAEAGYARGDRLSAKRLRAVDYHFVRENMELLLEARLYLDAADLSEYFVKASALAARCPLGRIMGIASSLRLRLGFYALLTENFDLFANPRPSIQGLSVFEQKPFLDILGEEDSGLAALLEVQAPRAFAEHTFVKNGRLYISGRLVLPGSFGAVLSDVHVRVASQGVGLGTFVPLVVRTPRPTNDSMGLYEWTAEVKPPDHAADAPLDFRIEGSGGGLTVRLRYTLGCARTSRTLRTAQGITQFFPSDEHRLHIVHLPAGDSKGVGQAWRRQMVKRDAKAWREGRKLAPWLILRLLTLFMRRRNYWVLAERSDTAQDSSYLLFSWLRKNSRDVRAFYVLRKGSAAWDRVHQAKGIVAHGSFQHKLLMLHAKVLISTQDIDSYLVPDDWNRVSFRNELAPRLAQKRVFLQHGVTHNGVGPQLHRGVTGLDLLVCASPQEAQYLTATTGYGSEIVQAGFPRFDRLYEARSKPKSRRILLMPTWRRYLVAPSYSQDAKDPGNFVGSTYEKFFSTLLASPELHRILDQFDVDIDFVPHYETASYFANEALHDRIQIVTDGGAQLPQMLRSTPLLITDYSSVMFDVAYAGGSVLQVPFDLNDFYSRHYQRGWFDPLQGGLGEVATNVKETLQRLTEIVERGFVQDDQTKARVFTYFSHHDDGSCERVYDQVRSLY